MLFTLPAAAVVAAALEFCQSNKILRESRGAYCNGRGFMLV